MPQGTRTGKGMRESHLTFTWVVFFITPWLYFPIKLRVFVIKKELPLYVIENCVSTSRIIIIIITIIKIMVMMMMMMMIPQNTRPTML